MTRRVARQYSGALGKVGNCQIGVSINAATDEASCPLDWRLFIPEEWDEQSKWNKERRAKAKLPEDVHHVEKWRLALEMIDQLTGWGIKPPVVLGDGAYGDITELRTGLEERDGSSRPLGSRRRMWPSSVERTRVASSARMGRLRDHRGRLGLKNAARSSQTPAQHWDDDPSLLVGALEFARIPQVRIRRSC